MDTSSLYLVTEICEGGELFDEIVKRQNFSESDAANILR
jgi:calcium-dependent protein kinase